MVCICQVSNRVQYYSQVLLPICVLGRYTSKVVRFNTFLPCLSIGRSVWRTSTNELQSSHTKQSARGAAVVNYWVRSNNSNSGDFPEARANRVILKSAVIT